MCVYKKLQARPLPERLLKLNGISARTIREHYKLYEGYVNKANETRAKLDQIDFAKGNATYSEIRALKRGESYALDGAKLHELYFAQLGGRGKPDGDIVRDIERQYGTYDRFLAEFRGAGLSGRGWAILAFDPEMDELFIYITDDQHDGHVIQSVPILPMDVFEHAYYIDYGTSRGEYIDAFFRNLDWSVINSRYVQAKKAVRTRFRLFG
jgi:Fe-Mn family superoxide dismutase